VGYRLTSAQCDGVVANTRAGAAFAQRLHRLGEERVHVLWNSVDLNAIDARVARSTQPAHEIFPGSGLKRLCLIGSVRPANDHVLALRVLRRLRDADPSWRLICAGESPAHEGGYPGQVLAERERLGLEPFVRFVGRRSDVVELLASSDVLLMTCTQGGFPLVALEAMACNTPVVSTDWGDVRPLLPDEKAQVPASRAEDELAAAVLDCHRRRAEIALAQRAWAERNGTPSAAAAALLRFYVKYLPLSVRRELAPHS
jgi:glycosyltransferase involved in cell wall biosynthesis